ncbi:MAG: DUF1501 domain-containing protein [Planctomycetaceae bacterium]|nr:DUF1501 domain-containing protein [Planctomycetaceae bacterium]
MLRVLSNPRRLCTGLTRRELLEAGGIGLGTAALGLPQLLESQARAAEDETITGGHGFGKAKNCILLFLYGSPSQLETYDMKPEAPVEIRGTMKPIASSLPGLDVCEYLPETAKVMDKVTVVRSVTHPFPVHGVAFATTGIPAIDVAMELAPHDPSHHPYFGSAVEYVHRQQRGGRPAEFPQNVALPFPFSSQRTGEVHRAGPYAAFLGSAYNPLWTEFQGKASRTVYKTLRDMKYDVADPYCGCVRDSSFRLSSTAPLDGLSLDRMDRRRSLLTQFDETRRDLDRSSPGRSLSTFQEMAYSLISSTKVAEALDVRKEADATRDLYGMTLFGQSCLAARRMIEAGTRLVSVFWDEYGLAGDAWDTHWNHYPRMTDQLLPPFDKAFSGLITDLDRRGILDETLVVVLSEHGRTPRINSAKGGGRDHWSRAYSVLFAGGGAARGRVIGATNGEAGDVVERPVGPKDLLATMFYQLGIDPHVRLPDRTGRPIPAMPDDADVIREILA